MDAPRIPSDALEGLMKKAFEEQVVDPGLFWDALINAHLILPLASAGMEEGGSAGPNAGENKLPILLGQDETGKYVVWIFTSPTAMTEYTEQDLRYVQMPSVELFESVKASTHDVVLIGPNAITLSLHPELINSLADGKVPEQPYEEVKSIPKDTSVFVGKATDDTSALEMKFRTLFQNMDDVQEACFIQIADDSGSRLLLGLRLKDESRENFKHVAAVVAKAAEGVLEKGKTMDITLLGKSLKGAFEKHGTPFFKR